MNKKSFIKQSAISFCVRLFGAFSGILMNLVIARNLNIEQSGLFFLAFALCSAIGMLCTLGLNNAFIRFVGGFHSEQDWASIKGLVLSGIKRAFLVALTISMFLCVFANLISVHFFSKPELGNVLQIMALAIPAYAVYQLISFAFQGLHKPLPSIALQNIINPTFVTLAVVVLIIFAFGLLAKDVAVIYVLGALVTCVFACYIWLKNTNLKVKSNYSALPAFYASAKPLWVMMLMSMLVQYSGQIITGIYVSAEGVAFFSVAQRVAMLTSFVLIAVNIVAAPRFAASAKQGKPEELRATSLLCSRLMIALATPVLVFMLVFPEFILSFFGAEYKQASLILQILVIGQFINVVTGSVGFLLNMTGHEKDMRNVVLFSGPLALILGFLLTPIYGATGAAIATAIALASQNLIAVYMVKKRLGFNTLNLIRQ